MKKSDISLQQFDDLEESLGEDFRLSSNGGVIYLSCDIYVWDGRLSAKAKTIRVAAFEIESFRDFESLSECVADIAARASSIFEAKETVVNTANEVVEKEMRDLDKTYFQSPSKTS